MSDRIDLFENVGNAVSCLSSVLGCLLRFIWLMILPKAVLVAKVMAAESQLVACVDADYYHIERPHQGLGGETPVLHEKAQPVSGPTKLLSIPVLGGLHHRYVRVAA